jgi:hypothetical protein
MQYDGSSLKAGVQFKCTGCGEMVVVGAAVPAAPRGATRKLTKGGTGAMAQPARGGTAVLAGRPAGRASVAGRPAPGGAQQQQPMGAPVKKDNTQLFVFGGIGVVVVGILIAVFVLASGPSPQAVQAKADEEASAKKKKEVADEDAKKTKFNTWRNAVIQSAHDMGPKIAAALSAKDDGGFFKNNVDWGLMAAKQRETLEKDKAWLDHPLYSTGEWVKEDKGAKGIVVRWAGKAARGPDDMQQRVLGYFATQYQGGETTYDKAVSESEKSELTWPVAGKTYVGKKLQISTKTSAKPLLFYCGALEGQTAVTIVWIDDPKAKENLTKKEVERPKTAATDPQNLGNNGQGDPMNPERPDPGTETPTPAELPEAVKTGEMPPAGLLTNVLRDIKDGNGITDAQAKSVQSDTNAKADKKKFIGACIDILIDMRAANDRAGIGKATSALLKIFKNMLKYDTDKYTYNFEMGGDPTSDDGPIRHWYEFYQEYKA